MEQCCRCSQDRCMGPNAPKDCPNMQEDPEPYYYVYSEKFDEEFEDYDEAEAKYEALVLEQKDNEKVEIGFHERVRIGVEDWDYESETIRQFVKGYCTAEKCKNCNDEIICEGRIVYEGNTKPCPDCGADMYTIRYPHYDSIPDYWRCSKCKHKEDVK